VSFDGDALLGRLRFWERMALNEGGGEVLPTSRETRREKGGEGNIKCQST